jgi:hypothetical protein
LGVVVSLSLPAREKEEDYDRVIALHAARATAFPFFFPLKSKSQKKP